jgi:hypothetical protein
MKRMTTLAAGAASVLLLFPASAPAPPAAGVPNVNVLRSCVPWGWPIPVSGFGFAPGSTVTVSAPLGHYYGPSGALAGISTVTAVADASGNFKTHLRAPKQERPLYQPRVVFAEGRPGIEGGPTESFDQVLLAKRNVCTRLDAQADAEGNARQQKRNPAGFTVR